MRNPLKCLTLCIPESHEYIRSRRHPHPSPLFSPTSPLPTQLPKASPVFTTPNIQNERPRMQLRLLLPVPCRLLPVPCT
ncbi:hypothetical protein ACN42_g4933 [Penicillium freii]|uniref:Uncharacterized protein n=1 Tax=Penicillium freii TaxID=48697 RepID=A0A101MKC5_PENFR|nr:hypothetical protein ACN42_g4933 [Penicillium freii]